MSTSSSRISIPGADVIRLIQSHLLEAGLSKTAQVLAKESGIGLAGSLQHNWAFHCAAGNYSVLLEQLSLIDRNRARISNDLVAAVHELAILELADAGDYNMAASLLRMMYSELQESIVPIEALNYPSGKKISRARLLDQKLAYLATLRAKDPSAAVPGDWYYAGSKQEMRETMGKALAEAIPQQPMQRLTSLLQQAIQWQAYTGELPSIKQWWEDYEEDGTDSEHNELSTRRKKRKKEFDLVLGHATSSELASVSETNRDILRSERIETYPSDPFAVVKLGKNVICESAVFLPDASGLVTGSSDGLIEIWDAAQQYTQLKLDLPYQEAEELLGQDSAVTSLAVSNDGTMLASGSALGVVLVWRVDTGKCLRTLEAHQCGVLCLAFSPDASHILTADSEGLVREFGLRTSRMLKEFSGHGAFVSHVSYHLINQQLFIFSASGDGTVRIYSSKSQEAIRILRPLSLGGAMSSAGSSIVADANRPSALSAGLGAVHSVFHLHSPVSTFIIVARGYRAFLVNYIGTVVRTYEDSSAGSANVFVAAAVSPSNQLLYCVREDGACCVFSVGSGELLGTIRDFGEQTCRSANSSSSIPEVTSVLSHPTKNVIAAYSSNAAQTRGQIVLWK